MARKSPGCIARRFSLRNWKEERNEGKEATHCCFLKTAWLLLIIERCHAMETPRPVEPRPPLPSMLEACDWFCLTGAKSVSYLGCQLIISSMVAAENSINDLQYLFNLKRGEKCFPERRKVDWTQSWGKSLSTEWTFDDRGIEEYISNFKIFFCTRDLVCYWQCIIKECVVEP